MDHSTRSVFDFQATLQLWSLVLTSQFMDKFSLWKTTCVSSGVFCSRKRIFFSDVFQTETLKLNDIFIVFQISPIQYSYWKISQWINTSQIKLAGFLSFFFSSIYSQFPMKCHQLQVRNFFNMFHWGKRNSCFSTLLSAYASKHWIIMNLNILLYLTADMFY